MLSMILILMNGLQLILYKISKKILFLNIFNISLISYLFGNLNLEFNIIILYIFSLLNLKYFGKLIIDFQLIIYSCIVY
jgi:hypothetical protein